MGFPSPAMDYQESRLSLDSYCHTGRPGVRACSYSTATAPRSGRASGKARC